MLPKRKYVEWIGVIKVWALLVLWAGGGIPVVAQSDAIRLLTIGNSFADDATHYLPQLAEAAGKKVIILRANLGGHSLEQHAEYLRAFRNDPNSPAGRPYVWRGANLPPFATAIPSKRDKSSLPELLTALPWDYVTIQQVSTLSHRPETYEPHATDLIAAIRRYAPQAKVLVHQTWAYRADHPWFAPGKRMTLEKMFTGLDEAYSKLAERHSLGVIPVGDAFWALRSTPKWRFVYPDNEYDYERPPTDAIPRQPGSLHVGWHWRTNRRTGEREFVLDAKHANAFGRYLGAAVWYERLFNDNVSLVEFVPAGIDPQSAAELRSAAHATLTCRQLGDVRFRVSIESPDAEWIKNHGPRFDTTAAVTSIRIEGREILIHGGLADEFNPKWLPPPGYDEARPGEPFLKVGVGLLQRVRERPYLFRHKYPVIKYATNERLTSKTQDELVFRQHINTGPELGWAYDYTKTYTLLPADDSPPPPPPSAAVVATLVIRYKLQNTGTRPIHIEHYNHNWFRLDSDSTMSFGNGYKLNTPFALPTSDPAPDALTINGGNITFHAPVREPVFPMAEQRVSAARNRATLRNLATGRWVEFSGDFDVSRFALFVDHETISPEVFADWKLAPGEQTTWTRTYRFGLDPQPTFTPQPRQHTNK